MGEEQRKHIRFLVKDDVIAALRNRSTKIGKVTDISLGGLAFEHIYEKNSNANHPMKNLFLMINGVCLSGVPCRVVYDVPVGMPNEYPPLITRFRTRRCGVQFETLSENQRTQLDFFLRTYAKEVAS